MANPNPFLRSPTDDLTDELAAQAARPVILPEAPKAAPAPKAEMEPPAAASTPAPDTSTKQARTPRWLPNADLMPIFESAAQQYNVPVNVVMALAHQESRYNPNAIGQPTQWGRAKGIMQYLDDTANGLGINAFDPTQAIPAAAKQIRERLDKGYSMEDAVKEHFAGPDRKKWGDKTATYGREVMEKVGSIGNALGVEPIEVASTTDTSHPAQVDLQQFQKDLDGDEAGRYQVLTDDYAAIHFSPSLMDRGAYEQTFRQNNPGASQAAVDYAMGEYDKQATQRAAVPTVENRFKTLQDPNAMFDQRLNQKLAGRGSGIVPALPDLQVATAQPAPPPPQPAFDAAKAEEESGFSAGASYLGHSLQSGLYDLAGAGARILDAVNPFTLSPGDAAVLYKNDPAKLKQVQDESTALILDRFARSMSKNAEEAQAAMSDRAKRDYAGLEYATLDQDKAAYRSPVKVIGDAVRSLPTTAAMAVSVYLTRGAALQAEKQALAAGLGEEAARRAAVEAGAKVMSGAGAATEGATGYAQQANQASYEASKLSMADMAKSPKFQQLVQEGFSPEAARAKIIADTGEQAGQIAGIVDAAVNKVGGEFLGKVLTEGGKLIPRIMKGAANEAATETVQSAGEQIGENRAVQQNINPNQSLTQGVGEAAAAGAAVGGLMGGVAAGAGGAPRAAQPGAQPAAQPTAPPTQVAPVPAAVAPAPKSSAPLSASLEGAAEQPQRVVATTPDGQSAAGTIQSYREDGDGNFIAKIVGDDGQVYTVTDEDGVQLTPVEPPKGPLSGALENAADQHAAEQEQAAAQNTQVDEVAPAVAGDQPLPAPVAEQPAAPAPFVPSEPPAPTAPADMTDEQLRTRMKYLAAQFRNVSDRGVQKKVALERRAIEAEINARAKSAETAAKEKTDASVEQPVAPGGNQAPAPLEPTNQAGAAPAAQLGTATNLPAAGRPVSGVGEGVAAVGGSAVADAALTDQHVGQPFTSDTKARAYIAKNRIGATHFVKRIKPGEFEIRRRPGAGATMDTAADKIAKQEEAVRKAAENLAARAAAKAEQQATAVPPTELDTAAHAAATSPTNDLPEPTEAQREAGNYAKGHVKVHGLDISIENPRGSTRSGQRPDGSTWSHEMSDHYGYIKRTEGADGEQIDVYVGPKPESDRVFVVDQLNQGDGSFDEHKAMLGYGNKQQALRAYKSNFDKGWKVGPVRQMTVDEFKAWIKDGDTTRPVAEHQTVANPTIQGESNGIDQRTEQQPDGAETPPGQQEAQQASTEPQAGQAAVLSEAEQGGKKRKPKPEKIAAAAKPKPEQSATPAAEQSAPSAPIADFGEKIHGARKDVWAGFREDMSAALPADVKDITLAKHWPEPNYAALIEAGVEPKVLAAFKALRDQIPAKPRLPYKAKRWGEQVTTLRDFANTVLNGDRQVDDLARELRLGGLPTIADRIEMYAGLGYPLFTKAKDYSLEKHHYTMFNGESPPGGVTKWELERDGRRSAYFDTQQEGIDALRKGLENAEDKATGKKVDLDLYRVTSNGDIVIGKKVGPSKFIDLKTGFKSVRDARQYLAEHRDELLELLEKKKDVRPERRGVNEPRVGVDRRKGTDIAPEQFADTFGFRGVQFGNYVEQKRRGADLNNAYDALLDMADVLGIPPKAISLNGTLGLAFGARGKGGKNAAAAHYEPGQTVINLTKTAGAGSLAHEWWHGLDNYFAKLRGSDSFVTQYPRQKMVPNAERKMVPDESIRVETLDAFRDVVDAIRTSGMLKRSRELDGRRTKDYWSTIEELTARAFESYVIDKAEEQGYSNDYLANIVSEKAHDAMNGMTGMAEPFPYPLRSEAPAINAAFDKLFQTLETREQDGKVALFSAADAATGGMSAADVEKATARLRNKWAGFQRVSVVQNVDGLPSYLAEKARAVGDAEGVYDPPTRHVYLIADNLSSPERAAFVAAHEVVGHGGLRMLRDKTINEALKYAAGNSFIKRLAVAIQDDRGEIPAHVAVDEAVAELAAAIETGDFQAIADRYGVTIPDQARGGLRGAVARVVEAVRRFIATVTKQPIDKVSNADVYAMIRQQQAAVEGRAGAEAVAQDQPALASTAESGIAGAIDRLMREKSGEVTVTVPGVGEVTIPYGDSKSGLAHIARRRGENFLPRVANLLQNGTVYEKDGQKGRVFLGHGADEAVLSLDRDGKAGTWLLSAYEKYPDLKAARLSEVAEERMPEGQYFTKDDLHKSLTSRGMLGQVIASMIEAGVVKLHGGPGKLPGKAKNVKGVQAVTMPDGTIHMVASNLTPRTAFPVLMHEMFHQGGEKLIGTKEWGNLMGRLGSLYRQSEQSSGKAREFFDRARSRVVAARKAGAVARPMEVEEFAAYAIEEYEKSPDSLPGAVRKWVEDLIGLVKTWMVQRYGKQIGQVTPAQLAAMARWALMDVAVERRGEIFGSVGERFSVALDQESNAEPVALTPPEQGTLRSIQSAVQDSMSRVKQVQNRITKLAGRTIGEKADYYLAETNRPGRIAARLEDAQNHLFQPLMERLAKSGFTQEQLSELLHAQHAHERNEAVARINPEMPDGGSGMTNDEADAILKLHENDTELHAIAQQARDIARATLDLKLAYGLLKQDDYDMLASMYENYVPLKGDGEYGPKIKRAMGHDAREEHILENIARDYQQGVVVGEKNLARQSLLRLVLQNPDPELWTVGVPPKGRYVAGKVYAIFKGNEKVASFTSAAQVQAFLEAKGANAGYTVRDSAGEQVKEFAKPLQDNEVMVYVKGDPVRIQIGDEKLARQLRPIIESRDLTRWFVEKMRALNRFKAAIYTGRNPAFIPRNMARDAMTGTLNMTGHHGAQVAAKAWAQYPAAFKGMLQYAATGKVPAGEFGQMLTEYRQHGGKVGASHMSDLEQQGKTLTRMFEDAYGVGGYLRDGRAGKAAWIGSRKLIGGLAHGIEIVNQAAENALRLSLYTTLRDGGATPAQAAQAAKTVTVDFDRKGEATGVLGALYLFINPAIQGTANMVRTMATGEHKAQAWALVGALTLAGMLTGGANMDDDKERWLGEEWDARTKNYIRYIGNRKISIPLSQEYSPFYAAGVALAEARRGESAMKSSLRLFSSFLDAYFPLQGAFHPDSDNHAADLAMATVPTAIRPHVESAFNRNSFGSQIVPENEQTKSRPDNLKMNRSTKGTVYDKAAQGIASAGEMLGAAKYENDITKVSPETLKHLWRTYTGGLGQFVTDSAGLAALMGEDLNQVESSDVPIVKDFVKPQDVKAVRGRYFDLAKEAKAAQEEFRQAKKAGDAEAMDKILGDAEKEKLLSLAKTVTSTNKAAAELADEKVDVLADDSLSTAQKRAKLKDIEKEEDALYRDAIDAFK